MDELGQNHPVLKIIARRANEAALDIDEINGSVQQRAAMTLIVETLDMIVPTLVAHPELLPIAALTLRSYAELLDRTGEMVETDPRLRTLLDVVQEIERAHAAGRCRCTSPTHHRTNGGSS